MSVEIAQYAAAVASALSDLPERVRSELLEDLPAHLAEVAAEMAAEGEAAEGVTLTDRLGPPAAYAAELRTTLDAAATRGGVANQLDAVLAGLKARWGRVDRRLGPIIGYERISDFGTLLRPAWWVLRGYLAAMLFTAVLGDHGGQGLLPQLQGSSLLGLLILAGFVIGSIWLGRRPSHPRLLARAGLGAATVAVVVFGLAATLDMDARLSAEPAQYTPVSLGDAFPSVADVYVLDAQGHVLQGVRLVDQDGIPLMIGWCAQTNPGGWRLTYPVGCRPENEPRLPWITASPQPVPWAPFEPETTPSATAAPSLSPSPSVTPPPGPGPTATPSVGASQPQPVTSR